VFPVNVPNVLTLLRILLVPVLVVALLDETSNGDVLAAIVFALASATDFVDGWLARTRDSITPFGKVMDPVADKLLVIAALVSLVSLDRLAAWVAMVIIARELAVTVARAQAPEVIPAAQLGKLKTVTQVAAIFFVILFDPTPGWVDGLVYAAVAVTVVSGVTFFLDLGRRQRTPVESSHSRIDV
jgi:CDP-diacylglycerol--glycerol-3-phosphate 3-phosphatidyltransferase